MAAELAGLTVAILAADGVEQVELEQPLQAVTDAGATTVLLSIEDGEIQAVNGDIHPAATVKVDRTVGDVSVDDFDALLLPGGAVNPDNLRQDADAGGTVVDEEVAIDGTLVSSRSPDDLPAFCAAAVRTFAQHGGKR